MKSYTNLKREIIMNKIEKIWNSLFEYWKDNEPAFSGCIGATQSEIDELEQALNIKLPESLKQSLKMCNSYPADYSNVKKSSCLVVGGAGELYNTKNILESYNALKETMYYDGEAMTYDYLDKTFLSCDTKFSKNWIPIYSWNCDIIAYLDLRLDSNIHGQILYEDIESGQLGIWADSYEDFLESIAKDILEYGEYREGFKKVFERVNKETRIN